MERIDVGVLGATGMVGTRLVRMLEGHPWFRLAEVGASDRSRGEALGKLVADDDGGPLHDEAAKMIVKSVDDEYTSPILLSALPTGVAKDLEPKLAKAGHLVVSNASSHRQDPNVPLIIPEINPDHVSLARQQIESQGGAIVTNPNCVVAGIAMVFHPLHEAFGLEQAVVTTFQAISGAGKPGPSAFDMIDNVLPFIAGEEDKIGNEVRKILGKATGSGFENPNVRLSATCSRVPVLHGHFASVSLAFRRQPQIDEVKQLLNGFRGNVIQDGLPSAPVRPIEVMEAENRPQPRLDRDRGDGMTVTVGRVRPCEVHHVKMFVLSHNLMRGAAGAALLNAELCHARGLTAKQAAATAQR
jgi:aspartate-semialdehyde dehydrogenase